MRPDDRVCKPLWPQELIGDTSERLAGNRVEFLDDAPDAVARTIGLYADALVAEGLVTREHVDELLGALATHGYRHSRVL